jgi:hypothetical protein
MLGFVVKISCESDAFTNAPGELNTMVDEIARILHNVADKVTSGDVGAGIINDINGHRVGKFTWTSETQEEATAHGFFS